jgi:hypothetical protein
MRVAAPTSVVAFLGAAQCVYARPGRMVASDACRRRKRVPGGAAWARVYYVECLALAAYGRVCVRVDINVCMSSSSSSSSSSRWRCGDCTAESSVPDPRCQGRREGFVGVRCSTLEAREPNEQDFVVVFVVVVVVVKVAARGRGRGRGRGGCDQNVVEAGLGGCVWRNVRCRNKVDDGPG